MYNLGIQLNYLGFHIMTLKKLNLHLYQHLHLVCQDFILQVHPINLAPSGFEYDMIYLNYHHQLLR